jgi:hypothetical protein
MEHYSQVTEEQRQKAAQVIDNLITKAGNG